MRAYARIRSRGSECEVSKLRDHRSARLRRRRAIPIPISTNPTTSTIGPTMAQSDEPLIAEPRMTSRPCRVQINPTQLRITPETRNGQIDFTGLTIAPGEADQAKRGGYQVEMYSEI